jgi:hypothetical protein
MKTRARVLATATVLALSSLFGLAGSAAASVPPPDEHPTAAVQRGTPPHDGDCGAAPGTVRSSTAGTRARRPPAARPSTRRPHRPAPPGRP